ncbi:MAG: transposase [Candidatus Saccharibacteria bacterium]
MPSRNIDKIDINDSYYHVYARGRGKQPIFQDDEDYRVFLNLFKRYLSVDELLDGSGRKYPHLRSEVELLCYCLMPNHFHLLLYQVEKGAMSQLMRGLMTSYSVYFNKKYEMSGPVFESRYKASIIATDAYLMHISRYIHLNPDDWRAYPYSSIHAYFGIGQPEWLQQDKIIDLFGTTPIYADFLDDYADYKKSLEEIEHSLANKIHIIK